jgi:hypothetical protein
MSLTASHGASKNQCADKRFSTADRSASSRTPVRFILPSSVARPQRPLSEFEAFKDRSGLRQNAIAVIRLILI